MTGPGLDSASLAAHVDALFPGSTLMSVHPLGPDTGGDKGLGYGRNLKLELDQPGHGRRAVVIHLSNPDGFGHDRRADRAAQAVLAFDTMGTVPGHVRPVDVGFIGPGPRLVSLRGQGEFYLVTEWAEGEPYATSLREAAERGTATAKDVALAERLASVLVAIHRGPARGDPPVVYARAWRDLLGSGEGIAGLVDGYPPGGAPGVSMERLRRLEHRCLDWRHRFHRRVDRLTPVHGDFHPFNLIIGTSGDVHLLDASRGAQGDPADDVSCLSINFLLFGLGAHRARWSAGLGRLWEAFFARYLSLAGPGVLEAAAPFFAWRALVLCHPGWYPHLTAEDRDRLLSFAERALERGDFTVAQGAEAMAW